MTFPRRNLLSGSQELKDKTPVAVPVAILIGVYGLFLAGDFVILSIDVRLLGTAGLATAILMLVTVSPVSRQVSWPRRFMVPFTCWVTWMMLTSMWAPSGARVQENLVDLAFLLIFVAAVAFILRRLSTKTLNWLWVIVYVAALVFAGTALLTNTVTTGQGRLIAFGGGPNTFVRIVSLGAVAAVALCIGKGKRNVIVIAGVPVVTVAALLSGSRGGVLALGAAAVGVLVLAMRSKSRQIKVQVIAAIAITGSTFAVWGWPRVAAYVQQRFVSQTLEQRYSSSRTLIWQDSLRLWRERPLVGQGLDGYWAGTSQEFAYAHNLILGTGVEGGIIGVILLVMTLIVGFRGAYRAGSFSCNLPAVAALLIFVSAMFSGSWYDSRLLWFFLVLGLELCTRDAETRGAENSGSSKVSSSSARDVARRIEQGKS